jgi:hypothetical protein
MREKFMDNWAGTPNILSASMTLVLLYINKVTLSDAAAIAAILAGVTTGALNVVKYFQMKKRERKQDSNL